MTLNFTNKNDKQKCAKKIIFPKFVVPLHVPDASAGDDGEPEGLVHEGDQNQRHKHQPHDQEQLNKHQPHD